MRLGPRCGSESVNLMAYVSGGRGSWREKAKDRKCLKGLNPFGRGNAPARPLHAMLGGALSDILRIMFELFHAPLYFTDRFPKVHIK